MKAAHISHEMKNTQQAEDENEKCINSISTQLNSIYLQTSGESEWEWMKWDEIRPQCQNDWRVILRRKDRERKKTN